MLEVFLLTNSSQIYLNQFLASQHITFIQSKISTSQKPFKLVNRQNIFSTDQFLLNLNKDRF